MPGHTKVLSKENNFVELSDVKTGMEILGYDRETGKDVWSKVITWFHRSQIETVYNEIQFKDESGNDRSFMISDWHNLAIQNSEGYEYAFPIELKK